MNSCHAFGYWSGGFKHRGGAGRARRAAEVAAIAAAEMGGAAKAGSRRHRGHAQRALLQQLVCPLQSQAQVVLRRRAVQKTLAQAFQLAQGDMGTARQQLRRQGRIHILFHQIQHPDQARMLNIQLARQILALALRSRAHTTADLAITDAGAEAGTGVFLYQVQHQIRSGGASGATDQFSVHLIE